jgi:hypothetical protein
VQLNDELYTVKSFCPAGGYFHSVYIRALEKGRLESITYDIMKIYLNDNYFVGVTDAREDFWGGEALYINYKINCVRLHILHVHISRFLSDKLKCENDDRRFSFCFCFLRKFKIYCIISRRF